jgi:hypothetical protein
LWGVAWLLLRASHWLKPILEILAGGAIDLISSDKISRTEVLILTKKGEPR